MDRSCSTSLFPQWLFDKFWGFTWFLDEWQHKTNDIGDYIPVEKLFRLLAFFSYLTVGVVIVILLFLFLRGSNFLKLETMDGFNLRKFFPDCGSLWILQNCGREKVFIFHSGVWVVWGLFVKRFKDRIGPWDCGHIQEWRANEVILCYQVFTISSWCYL